MALSEEEKRERRRKWRNTPYGRATYLLTNYRNMDILNGFNKDSCDLTVKWIMDNIFSKPCAHCGESDWHKIGCNRLDNSKPHTMDNVEPCCMECNVELVHPKKRIARIRLETKTGFLRFFTNLMLGETFWPRQRLQADSRASPPVPRRQRGRHRWRKRARRDKARGSFHR